MRPVHVLCSLVGFAVVCIACAGGVEPGVAEGPDAEIDATASEATGAAEQPETASLSIALRGMASRTPELIDANASGTYVALRIPTLRDADSDDIARCAYAGLADGVDGMELALVDFETQSVQQWTVYRTPTPDDSSCTNEADAVAELTLAKEAMAAAGLDSTQRGAWFMPAPFTAEGKHSRRPTTEQRTFALPSGEVMSVVLGHTSDSGYHTYTGRVTGSIGEATVSHSPNPAMGGAGDLEVRGAVETQAGTVVLFEATHGPAGIWSSWMLTPPR